MKTLSQTRTALGQNRLAYNSLRLASNVADTETVTIGADVFEFDNNSTITAGRIQVDVSGGLTPANASTKLVNAINASNTQKLTAVKISDNEVVIYGQTGNLATTETLAGANNAWASATMVGADDNEIKARDLVQRAANATEVALGVAHFVFPFAVVAAQVGVRTSAGVVKAWDGAVAISGQRVTLDNTGATDWAATDVLVVDAVG